MGASSMTEGERLRTMIRGLYGERFRFSKSKDVEKSQLKKLTTWTRGKWEKKEKGGGQSQKGGMVGQALLHTKKSCNQESGGNSGGKKVPTV